MRQACTGQQAMLLCRLKAWACAVLYFHRLHQATAQALVDTTITTCHRHQSPSRRTIHNNIAQDSPNSILRLSAVRRPILIPAISHIFRRHTSQQFPRTNQAMETTVRKALRALCPLEYLFNNHRNLSSRTRTDIALPFRLQLVLSHYRSIAI